MLDTQARESALKMFTYGLYIVAAKSGEDVGAGTVSWLSQASFEPPLVMVAVRKDSRLHAVIEQARAFSASVVSTEKRGMAASFFKMSQVEPGKINGYATEDGTATGSPILAEAPAWIEARVTGSLPGGDHTVFVAEIVNAGANAAGAQPLALRDTEWTYGG